MTDCTRQKLLAFGNNDKTFIGKIGITCTDIDDGTATLTLTPSEDNRNHWGIVHGGALYTLCDTACGMATMSMCRPEKFVSVNGNIDFLTAGTGVLTAVATVDRMGGKLCFCSVKVHDENGKLVANGHGVLCFTGEPLEL